MKVVAYSDAHRGITANYDKLWKFDNFIKQTKPDIVIGCGDNYTLDWIPWSQILEWQPSGLSIARQKDIARSIQWVELEGNHDTGLHKYAKDLFPVIVSHIKEMVVDGVTYTHGDQFDPTITYWWMPLERIFWKWMPWLYPRLFGTPSVLKKSGKDENYSRVVGTIEARVQRWAEGGVVDKSVVFGHTHSEFLKHRSLHFIANCGDFVDSCSCVVVTDGIPEIKWF